MKTCIFNPENEFSYNLMVIQYMWLFYSPTLRFCLHQQRSCIGKIVIVSCIRVNWKFSQIWWKVYLLQLCGMLGASHIIWTSLLSFTDTHWFNSRMLRKEIHPQGFQQCKLPGNYCQEIETLQLMTSFSTFFS